MQRHILLVGGDRRQTHLAARLEELGRVETLGVPGCPDRTEPGLCDLLILPSPCLDRSGGIRAEGPSPDLPLDRCGPETLAFGGGLGSLRPRLEAVCGGVRDLLELPTLAAENARLTAEAALVLTVSHTESDLRGRSCAVLGWGRIAKCLAPLLRAHGAEVLVSARRPEALAEAQSLGFAVCPLEDCRLRAEWIFNTIPARVLSPDRLSPKSLWIELASAPGGLPEPAPLPVLAGGGLPGRLLPRAAAELLYREIRREVGEPSSAEL